MPKVLTSFALAAVLIVAAPLITAGVAQAKAGTKVCKSKVPSTGKVKTWRCSRDVPCCVSHELGIYVCGSPMVGCI
jgi:hypothetical protein